MIDIALEISWLPAFISLSLLILASIAALEWWTVADWSSKHSPSCRQLEPEDPVLWENDHSTSQLFIKKKSPSWKDSRHDGDEPWTDSPML